MSDSLQPLVIVLGGAVSVTFWPLQRSSLHRCPPRCRRVVCRFMVATVGRPGPAPGHAGISQELEGRRELAALLAGAADLAGDYDSTIELARHLRAQRAAAGQAVDIDAVILDLEACLRSAPPVLPEDGRPGVRRLTGADLVDAIASARAGFERRIRDLDGPGASRDGELG